MRVHHKNTEITGKSAPQTFSAVQFRGEAVPFLSTIQTPSIELERPNSYRQSESTNSYPSTSTDYELRHTNGKQTNTQTPDTGKPSWPPIAGAFRAGSSRC